jgi:predicted molibdopterin-dependent oxidoreductase YjgC
MLPIWRNLVNSAFRELQSSPERVAVTFDGTELMLPEGANLAAALLLAGVDVFRATPVSGAPRAPYCMMGACFDCLIEVSGVTRQACMMQVHAGLVIAKPKGRAHEAG